MTDVVLNCVFLKHTAAFICQAMITYAAGDREPRVLLSDLQHKVIVTACRRQSSTALTSVANDSSDRRCPCHFPDWMSFSSSRSGQKAGSNENRILYASLFGRFSLKSRLELLESRLNSQASRVVNAFTVTLFKGSLSRCIARNQNLF